jgi:MFS family permease
VFSPAYKKYALAAATAVYTLNLVDRGLIALLLQPIKEDLHLTDTQLGLLTGIAFGLFYATVGIPIARWADRGNRVNITSLAIGLWGVTVMSCLFVTTYTQLVFARIAAAVGESGCKPPTYALIGDYFTQAAQRTRAMSIYVMGSPLSTLISFVVGGWLNARYGWRLTFFLMGIPGLLLAVLFKLTVREPRVARSGRASAAGAPLSPSISAVLAILWHQASYRHLTVALLLLYTMSLGLSPWFAAFLIRSHGMKSAELGVWLGLIFSVGGIAGNLLGGYVATRWFPDNERAQMRMSAVGVTSVFPCFLVFLMASDKYVALISLGALMVLYSVFLGPTYALMQRLVSNEMRATTMAVVMLLTNVIGFGIGPQIVGLLSDALAPVAGQDSLRYAMIVMSIAAPLAGYHFWRVGCTVRQDVLALGQGEPREGGRGVDLRRNVHVIGR